MSTGRTDMIICRFKALFKYSGINIVDVFPVGELMADNLLTMIKNGCVLLYRDHSGNLLAGRKCIHRNAQ